MPPIETIVTYIMFVDYNDRLIDKIPVAPSRRHHLEHPDMIPLRAVACQYYDIRSWIDPSNPPERHFVSSNNSELLPVSRRAHVH
jgi:hypothetical protein